MKSFFFFFFFFLQPTKVPSAANGSDPLIQSSRTSGTADSGAAVGAAVGAAGAAVAMGGAAASTHSPSLSEPESDDCKQKERKEGKKKKKKEGKPEEQKTRRTKRQEQSGETKEEEEGDIISKVLLVLPASRYDCHSLRPQQSSPPFFLFLRGSARWPSRGRHACSSCASCASSPFCASCPCARACASGCRRRPRSAAAGPALSTCPTPPEKNTLACHARKRGGAVRTWPVSARR